MTVVTHSLCNCVNGEEVDSINTERINSVMAPTEEGEAVYVLRALGTGFEKIEPDIYTIKPSPRF